MEALRRLDRVRVAFRFLDVFTEEPFAGTQLAVVREPPEGLDARMMQILAREIGFSETTYVTAIRESSYDVRIFTPRSELPFAGHPTLGTAFALVSEGRVAPTLVQTSEAGDVPVEVDLERGTAWMRQLPPVFGPPYKDRVAVAHAAGLGPDDLLADPILSVSTGIAHLMVPVASEDALRRAVRNDPGCARVCAEANVESLYLFVIRAEGDVMARMFDMSFEIGEDPATGSAAGPLGVYLAEHGLARMPVELTIAQGEVVGRPSFLHVEVSRAGQAWSARVGGGVRIVGEGAFEV
jgi:trans-2,3-dihydro-3-hydroxyanthranilate isomerase